MSEESNNDSEILAWQRFKNGTRWKYIISYLIDNIKDSEKIIKTPGKDNESRYTERDIHIIKQQLAKQLIEIPDYLIETLKGSFKHPLENDDPYMYKFGDDADDPAEDTK